MTMSSMADFLHGIRRPCAPIIIAKLLGSSMNVQNAGTPIFKVVDWSRVCHRYLVWVIHKFYDKTRFCSIAVKNEFWVLISSCRVANQVQDVCDRPGFNQPPWKWACRHFERSYFVIHRVMKVRHMDQMIRSKYTINMKVHYIFSS